jgi:ketosteroid isomerase-like protein
MRATSLVLATCLAVAVGCAAPPPAALSDADVAALRQHFVELARALSPEDNAAWARLFTSDARMMFESAPMVSGRDAIQEWGESPGSPVLLSISFADIAISGGGDWAWATSTYVATVGGLEGQVPGKQLIVFRRQDDGTWLQAAVHASSDLPPTGG